MDYKKDCEERLRRYAKADETLEILRKRVDKLSMNGKPYELGAIDYSKVGGSSKQVGALDSFVEVQHIIKQIQTLEDDKEIIAEVLDKMKKNHKEDYKFIEIRYLQDTPMSITSERLGYSDKSSRTVYKIKDRSLKTFAMYF